MEIVGTINEARRLFIAETGERGEVEFGRTFDRSEHEVRQTTVRVSMLDGRNAYGRYKNPKQVILKVRKGSRKARVRP